jgi:PhnB protein
MPESPSAPTPVRPIPAGYHSVTAALTVHDAARAIDFYTLAFDARELGRMPGPDGRLMHAELQIGDSRVMLSDEMPDLGGGPSPRSLGGTPVTLQLYVEDADSVFQRAIDAGAVVAQPLEDQFWGDRYGKVIDPFGHAWGILTHIEDVSDEEIMRRMQAMTP